MNEVDMLLLMDRRLEVCASYVGILSYHNICA